MTTTAIVHSDENCQELASEIVQSWDLDSLVDFAVCTLEERFQADSEVFQQEWKDFFGEDD